MLDGDVRLVPMTREQRDALETAWPAIFASQFVRGMELVAIKGLLDGWDAAPSDPAEAITEWFDDEFALDDDSEPFDEPARRLLRALGVSSPHAAPAGDS